MIERNFIKQGIRNAEIEAYLRKELEHAEYSHSEIKRTPLNTRIMIYAGRPGMIIGRAGSNIQRVTENLEKKFGLGKPQIEIMEIQNPDLDARVVAKKIAAALEKGNNARKVANIFIKKILQAGASGVEIVIGGKSGGGGRSKTDKFLEGYLKKCGDTAERYANRAKLIAKTRPGAVGIKVRIMRELPEEIRMKKEVKAAPQEPAKVEEIKPAAIEAPKVEENVAEVVAEIPKTAEAKEPESPKSEEAKAEAKPKIMSTESTSSSAKLKKERKPRAKKEKAPKAEETATEATKTE